MRILINANVLTDGSISFDVSIGETVLHASTEKDAYALTDKIKEAIDSHTVDEDSIVDRAFW